MVGANHELVQDPTGCIGKFEEVDANGMLLFAHECGREDFNPSQSSIVGGLRKRLRRTKVYQLRALSLRLPSSFLARLISAGLSLCFRRVCNVFRFVGQQ